MNYPLLSVSYDSATGVASLTQSRFLTDPENADPGDDYRWFVPLTYTFVGDGREDFEGTGHPEEFMRPEQTQMDLEIGESDLPVIFNIQVSSATMDFCHKHKTKKQLVLLHNQKIELAEKCRKILAVQNFVSLRFFKMKNHLFQTVFS